MKAHQGDVSSDCVGFRKWKPNTEATGNPLGLIWRSPVELDGEAQVGDAAGAVLLHQDVLALQVPVGDGRLALRAVDLGVQVAEAAGSRVGQPQQRRGVQRVDLQEVVQGAVLMVVCDEEELREGARTFNVRCDEAWRAEEKRSDFIKHQELWIRFSKTRYWWTCGHMTGVSVNTRR